MMAGHENYQTENAEKEKKNKEIVAEDLNNKDLKLESFQGVLFRVV